MPKSRIPSPARSEGPPVTPRRYRSQGTRSVGSPVPSTSSRRLSNVVDKFKDTNRDSFAVSPLRKTILSDNTEIEMPRRKSWWRKVNNSRDVTEVLENEKPVALVNAFEELDVEVLSQDNEKKNYTMDLPESSDGESITSIVIPQRKLFTQTENVPQKKFVQVIDNRETITKHNKTNFNDKTVVAETKNLFAQTSKRPPIFPSALLNLTPDKTVNKTKDLATEVRGPPRNLFGNRPVTKRKNMFTDFIVSESEDEIPEILPKRFAFPKENNPSRRSEASKGLRDSSPTSSITTDIEMDDWKLLPSSTMIDHFGADDLLTPRKSVRLSKINNVQNEISKPRKSIHLTNNIAVETSDVNLVEQVEPNVINTTKQTNKEKTEAMLEITKQNEGEAVVLNQTKSIIQQEVIANNQEDEGIPLQQHDQEGEVEKAQEGLDAFNHEAKERQHQHDQEEEVEKAREALDASDHEAKERQKQYDQQGEVEKAREGSNAFDREAKERQQEHDQEGEVENTREALDAFDHEAKEMQRNAKQMGLVKNKSVLRDLITQENDFEMEQNVDKEKEVEVNVQANKTSGDQTIEKQKEQLEVSNKKESIIEDEDKNEMHAQINIEANQEEGSKKQNEEDIYKDKSLLRETEAATVQEKESKIPLNNQSDEEEEISLHEDAHAIDQEESDQEIENSDQNQIDATDQDQAEASQEIEASDQEGTDAEQELEEDEEEQEQSDQENNKDRHEIDVNDDINDQHDNQAEEEKEVEDDAEQEISDEILQDVDENAEQEVVDDAVQKLQDVENWEQNNEKNQETEDDDEHADEEQDDNDDQEIEEDDEQNDADIEASLHYEEDEALYESEEVEDVLNGSQDQENQDEGEEGASDVNQDQNRDIQDEDEENENEDEQDESNEMQVDDECNANESDQDESNELQAEDECNANESHQDESYEMQTDDESNANESDQEISEHPALEEQKESELHNSVTNPGNTSHNTTREQVANTYIDPIRRNMSNEMDSFNTKGRNTSVRKTKSLVKNFSIRPSMAPPRESTGFSDGTKNSSAEGSGWDSHRTTRKTLRQTFGKDFTPRKSLRALVMEKSAKRQTAINEANEKLRNPQANSTELPDHQGMDTVYDENEDPAESDHEISRRTRQTTLEMYLQKVKKENMDRNQKIKAQVENSIKTNPMRLDALNFRVPSKPTIRRAALKSLQPAPKVKRIKTSVIPLDDLPPELIVDMKYKPPKRFSPNNAAWITKRLYKFLETKLEPKYDYKARIRAEKLVEMIYNFVRDMRRVQVAPAHAVAELKREMARLDIVNTHFDFYNFFNDYLPTEVKIKVVPDIVNDIPLPREGVFAPILT